MKILILGLGFVGRNVARRLKAAGHIVIGTTTTPAKVDGLRLDCDDVVVLSSDERERIAELTRPCDAVIVTVGPNLARAADPATRDAEYRRALVVTCENAAAANMRCLFASSLSVYGDGGPGSEPITERSPLSASAHASPRSYQAAEASILSRAGGCVLRFPDIYGAPTDLSYLERLRLGHSLMGGTVPFAAEALLYRIHVDDAARALVHTLQRGLTGVYNAILDDVLPPTNQALFDRLADAAGLGRLRFAGSIRLPGRPISGQKLRDTGFGLESTTYEFA
jgi:nucleoside-diphosphate-sugar epimerase